MQFLKRKHIPSEQKENILTKIKENIRQEEEIVFAYLYGSFSEEDGFNDVDIGVYVDEEKFPSDEAIFKYSLSLAVKIEMELEGFEIDICILNQAPLSFQYQVITEGKVIVEKENDRRVDFECRVRDLYFDFLPHSKSHYQIVVLGK